MRCQECPAKGNSMDGKGLPRRRTGNSPSDTHFKVFKSAHTQKTHKTTTTPCAPLNTKNYIENAHKNSGGIKEKLERESSRFGSASLFFFIFIKFNFIRLISLSSLPLVNHVNKKAINEKI